MEYFLAKNTEEDFQGLFKLEEESDLYHVDINEGTPFIRVPFVEQSKKDYRKDFSDNFKNNHYLLFAKDDHEYVGCISGYIEELPQAYQSRNIGYLDDIIVAKKHRGQGISSEMRDLFFEWLRSKNVSYCTLDVKIKNTDAVEIYKKWGFKTDALHMWKKI
ncbi:MAG: GNAT family N-acetyltransferase [Candidatus Parcubacteria bacterium]|nr:GNAT family N-acetyltransferase [Candidatus Parcubacteria bacterium]